MTPEEQQIADSLLAEIKSCDSSYQGIAIDKYSKFLNACQARQTLSETLTPSAPPTATLVAGSPGLSGCAGIIVPEGWELPPRGTMRQRGDRFLLSRCNWNVGSADINDWAETKYPHRPTRRACYIRAITPATLPIPEGYVILPPHETVQDGDLVYVPGIKEFRRSIRHGRRQAPRLCYIRPVAKSNSDQVPQPLIPAGWRLLSPSEVLTSGDMYAHYRVRDTGSVSIRDWVPTIQAGQSVLVARGGIRKWYIRKIVPEFFIPAGWRLLLPGETIQAGDYLIRCQLKTTGSTNLADWCKSFCAGWNAERATGDVNHPHIRKI